MQAIRSLNAGSILAVTHRQFIVWRKLIWSALATNVANPLLFLFAFGLGLGQFVERMGDVPYLAFVVPGMTAYAAMFAASFETTIGAYTRYQQQGNWDAIMATPVSLAELLLGEVLWAALKALLSAACVILVGWLWGGVLSLPGALISLPLVFAASLGFACFGLLATTYAHGYEYFSYFFSFWITPMFVFCGVFFDISRFPDPVQVIAWAFPMTHLIAIVRPLTTGAPLDPVIVVVHIAYLGAISALAFWLAYREARRRMFD
ncbi:ABC transporter permease [Dichotomicrobium thermohalophilum]|uniref:Transport permease protein n=1 Tax=Dichotomicrobium thermohalophilum TaxID=933063 RepID=A0A397Q5E7_9HYPH|nr:ABC transporter permease [Dichotomicrobium thermohalophilum]RIA55025.1 lipooligosaccharide transport system permease protein [Dichotomicrobium thermohalophilum]